MFKSYDSERNVIAIGTTENKIPAPIFNREAGTPCPWTPSPKNRRTLTMLPYPIMDTRRQATGDKFSALDKGFRLTKSQSERNV